MWQRLPGLKIAIFCKRIVLFNETFAPLERKGCGKANRVLRHDGIAGQSAEEVASTYVKVIQSNRDKRKFIFWADNCSAQNNNWFLFTAIVTNIQETAVV